MRCSEEDPKQDEVEHVQGIIPTRGSRKYHIDDQKECRVVVYELMNWCLMPKGMETEKGIDEP
jgi:hypothetical protein